MVLFWELEELYESFAGARGGLMGPLPERCNEGLGNGRELVDGPCVYHPRATSNPYLQEVLRNRRERVVGTH